MSGLVVASWVFAMDGAIVLFSVAFNCDREAKGAFASDGASDVTAGASLSRGLAEEVEVVSCELRRPHKCGICADRIAFEAFCNTTGYGRDRDNRINHAPQISFPKSMRMLYITPRHTTAPLNMRVMGIEKPIEV